jgi:hypothetical protein
VQRLSRAAELSRKARRLLSAASAVADTVR